MLLAQQVPEMAELGAVVGSYVIGSIPFSLLIARWIGGVDLRRHGSGNIGATNVARTMGLRWGLLALLLDALKGLLPTALLPALVVGGSPVAEHLPVACGVAAIAGHMFPCWLGFRGGKGVATALGVISVLAPVAMLGAFAVFAVTFAVWRIVSLSSILAAIAFAAAEFWLLLPAPFGRDTWSRAVFAVLVPALIIIRHRANLVRLWRGQEPRFERRRRAVER